MKKRIIISWLNSLLFIFDAYSADPTDLTVLDTFKTYNKIRSEKYNNIEDIEKEKRFPIALKLDSLDHLLQQQGKSIIQSALETKNGEFSTFKSIDTLLKASISPHIVVTDVEKMDGGFVSGEIYRIETIQTDTNTTESYFLKYLRKTFVLVSSGRCYGEKVNLSFLMNNPRIQEIQNHITIILPELIAEYTDASGEKKDFIILPGARGKSFSRIVKDIGKGQNVDPANNAFKALGSSLAQMHHTHRRFATPPQDESLITKKDFINAYVLSHTDLHGDNVFYCQTTQQIYFIDAESMAYSFDENGNPNSPIAYDLLYMLLMSSRKFGDFMPKNGWEPFKYFLKGYTDTYPSNERLGIYDYLDEALVSAKKVGFKDLFRHFSWEKTMALPELAGAEKLTTYIRELRLNFKKEQMTHTSDEAKEKIEQYYIALKAKQQKTGNIPDNTIILPLPSTAPQNNALPPNNGQQGTVAHLTSQFEAFIKEKKTLPLLLPKK